MPVFLRRISLTPSRKIPLPDLTEPTPADEQRMIEAGIRAGEIRANLLREAGFPADTDVSGRFSPEQVAAGAVIRLEPTTAAQTRGSAFTLQQKQALAAGQTLVMGRPVSLVPAKAPRLEGGRTMGIRAGLIAPGFLPTNGGATLLGGLIQGGFDIANTLIASKLGLTGVPSPSPVAPGGALIPAGGPVGMAAVSAAIVAAGGAIVGSVIRISSRAWAAIPALVKQAAVALGLTVAFTDIGLDFPGGGGDLSQAQQRKIARFQQLTGAGVPPGIAARATGIGRRRRRGLSWFELRGFRKISHMLGHVGMVPRGLRGARAHRGHHHHK